ncbi:MAG: glycosyltransferase [Gemmatimonadota bacterium]|nr:MAG: glycosyltransferase [Gemmatimonadota bacterium]
MHVLIAIPAFDEEATLGSVLANLPRVLGGAHHTDVVVIDDGSTDRTVDVARELGVRVVSHRRNLGLGRAFNTAVGQALECRADVLVTIDADGQFDAQQIPDLIAPIVAGEADLVTGSRFLGGKRPAGMPRAKYWGNRFFSALMNWLLGERLRDVSCGFRAYSLEAILNLNLLGKHTYTQESIFDLVFKGLRVTEIPITVRYFQDRKSRVASNLIRYGLNALKIIIRTARDFMPLRFFGIFAGVVLAVGAALDLWLLIYWLRTGSFSPYKFVGFTGTALLVVGILVLGFALLADMLDRLRVNQERLLYQQRKVLFGQGRDTAGRKADARVQHEQA